MITLHKTEIARQNDTLSIFLETPQNFTNHVFRGAHVLLRGAELPRSSHPVYMCNKTTQNSAAPLYSTENNGSETNNVAPLFDSTEIQAFKF